MKGRLLRASALTAALILAVLAGEALVDSAKQGFAPGGGFAVPCASDGRALSPLPFEDEVLALSGREDARLSADGRVAGFLTDASPGEAFSEASRELEKRGWKAVESGHPSLGSFVKREGKCRWVLVECMEAGQATSVVVQCFPCG